MSQPGVLDVEFVWPSTYGVVIYDSSKTTIGALAAASKDDAKREFEIISDQEFQ